jgi:hypothetical protein
MYGQNAVGTRCSFANGRLGKIVFVLRACAARDRVIFVGRGGESKCMRRFSRDLKIMMLD